MTPLLPVPWISQLGPGASMRHNDCGAAAGLMLLRAYGLGAALTVDDFYRATGQTVDAYLSVTQISGVLCQHGLETDWQTGQTIGNLYMALADKRPAMLLINYGVLVDAGLTELHNFRGSHFVVAVGADIESAYIHDPYRAAGGGGLAVPITTFGRAWSELVANPQRGMLVPEIRIGEKPAEGVQYLVRYPMNVRNGPGTNWRIVGGLAAGVIVTAVEVAGDWARIGATRWLYIGNVSWVKRV